MIRAYQLALYRIDMEIKSELTRTKSNTWYKEVCAPFKKVVAFDLLFYGLGVITGAGIIGAILLS